jgi:hypothetical protein
MAHFARIDKNTNRVLHVHVVDNVNCINPKTDQEDELTGIAYLKIVHKSQPWISEVNFVQTSYHGIIRKNFAGVGYSYDKNRDAFIPIKPEGNYALDEKSCQWNLIE